jgi:hypothetical protein
VAAFLLLLSREAPCFLANDADGLNAFDWIKQAVEA